MKNCVITLKFIIYNLKITMVIERRKNNHQGKLALK